jgi:hypothetical protein
MTTYNAAAADWKTVEAAFFSAIKYTEDPKIWLALFETGMVESNFHNLNHGDRDSVGYLQQRPSMGWPNPTNIDTATRSFVTAAKKVRKEHPSYPADKVAQAVQRSAYPGRYKDAEKAAKSLLARVQKQLGSDLDKGLRDILQGIGAGVSGAIGAVGSGTAAGAEGVGNGLDQISDSIRNAAAPLVGVGRLATGITHLFLPSNFLRLVSGIAGSMFLLFGIYLLTKEVRNG